VSQRHALASLFTALTLAFATLSGWAAAGAGGSVGRWLVAVAAAVLAGWFASVAWPLMRSH
jgi:hypothetical protein